MGNNTQGKNILNREFSSGGVVFRKDGDEILWLVRKTATSSLFPKSHWMLPKGWIDNENENTPGPIASGKIKADEDSLHQTAIREVREETGVDAEIIKKIGTVKFFYTHPERGKILKFVTYYLMERKSELKEGFDFETSEISWLPFDEAHKILSFSREKKVLQDARDFFVSLV